MNTSMIPVFEEKLRAIKKRIKRHIHDIPRDKVKKSIVSSLLGDANKLKKTINQYRAENKKPEIEREVTCPNCSHTYNIK